MGINCITSHSLISGWGVHWLPYIYNRKRMKQQQTSGLLLGSLLFAAALILIVIFI